MANELIEVKTSISSQSSEVKSNLQSLGTQFDSKVKKEADSARKISSDLEEKIMSLQLELVKTSENVEKATRGRGLNKNFENFINRSIFLTL